jgi:hypothetical protein
MLVFVVAKKTLVLLSTASGLAFLAGIAMTGLFGLRETQDTTLEAAENPMLRIRTRL